MDFPDTFTWPVSDSQAYKQAGNSIVVNVLYKILKNLNIDQQLEDRLDGNFIFYDVSANGCYLLINGSRKTNGNTEHLNIQFFHIVH